MEPNKDKMISVIIPVYNVEKYIDRCIESVVNQTFADFEVVLIDDGSTDCSGIKCLEWEKTDSRIHVVQQQNKGLGPTRNLGVQLAKYEYITFLDSDDWWDVHYLEKMMQPILENDVDIVCCDIHYCERDAKGDLDDNISELRIPANKILFTSDNIELINTARTFMWGKIYKKKLFVDNRIVQPAHAYEDVPITPLIIAKATNIYRVGFPLYYYYRKRQGSLANSVDSLMDMEKSIEELIANFKQEDIFELYQEQLKKMVYSQVRFIINKAQLLCEEKEKSKLEKIYSDLLKKFFPELINIKDKIFIVGSKEIKKAIELISIDTKQIEYAGNQELCKDILVQGVIIVSLLDIHNEQDYEIRQSEFVEIKASFCGADSLKAIIVLRTSSLNAWQNKFYEYIKQNSSVTIKSIRLPFGVLQMSEKQLWDLADEIFYAI